MATIVHMPEILTGVTEAAVQTWLVSPGQTVSVGTALAEIETDKAVVEYAAEVAGVVLQVLVPEGDQISIGAPILVIGAEGEALPAPGGTADDAALADERPLLTVPAGPVPDNISSPAPEDSEPGSARRFASPLVRRLAREREIDLSTVQGSGPRGRIVRRDLDVIASPVTADAGHLNAAPTAPAGPVAVAATEQDERFDDIPLTGMRRAIARRLTESKTTVPHFYVEADCRVDALLTLRRQVNESSDVRVSVNDFVLKAVAGALAAVPEANATWAETAIRRYRVVDVAVAVAIEGGLVTPVLRGVDRLSLTQVSTSVAALAQRAREGRLRQHELEGGSFSVSNLGMYGVSAFSAIINPPHAGILAVGAARQVPVVEDGAVTAGTVMTVTLSADHRVVDGAVAAQWLRAFVQRIENPLSILI